MMAAVEGVQGARGWSCLTDPFSSSGDAPAQPSSTPFMAYPCRPAGPGASRRLTWGLTHTWSQGRAEEGVVLSGVSFMTVAGHDP